jgi:hypothetical protein
MSMGRLGVQDYQPGLCFAESCGTALVLEYSVIVWVSSHRDEQAAASGR